jgi:hypothetical protein
MLSIKAYPLYIAPVYRPVVFDVNCSVNIADHPELQVKATLYIKRGNIFESVAVKYQQRYNNETFYRFNFANILQSYITYDSYDDTTLAIISANNNSIRTYYVEFQEMYAQSTGEMHGFWRGRTSEHIVVNSALQHTQTQSLNPWTILGNNNPVQSFTYIPSTPIIESPGGVIAVSPVKPLTNGHVISDHGSMMVLADVLEFTGNGVVVKNIITGGQNRTQIEINLGAPDQRLIEFDYPIGADDDITLTAGANQATTWTSEVLDNVATILYEKNSVAVSRPFVLAVSDVLKVTITRTNPAAAAKVTLKNW